MIKRQISMFVIMLICITFAACGTVGTENTKETKKDTLTEATSKTTVGVTTFVPIVSEEMPTDEETTTSNETICEDEDKPEETITKYEPAPKKRVTLYVKNIRQLPELPMGCEIVSATMALNHYGFDIDKMSMLKYQPMMEKKDENGNWGDPSKVFVGNPATYQYGCYSPVIKKAIEDYWKDINVEDYEVVDLGNSNLTDLFYEIDEGNPVILWVSTKMQDIETNKVSWTLEDGTVFHWTSHEHCVCLIGYDTEKDTVIISDPYDEREEVEYPRERVEEVYSQMSKQALVIHQKSLQ